MLPSSGYTRLNTVRSSNNIFTWPTCFSKVVLFSWSNFLYIFFFSCFSLLGFLVFKALSFLLYFFFFILISFLFLICSSLSKQIKNKKEIEDLELEIWHQLNWWKRKGFAQYFQKRIFSQDVFFLATAHFIPSANSVQIWSWKIAMVARYDVINSIRLATSKKKCALLSL